jgi:hypothetical protein
LGAAGVAACSWPSSSSGRIKLDAKMTIGIDRCFFHSLGGFEAVTRIASDRVMARQHSAKSSNLEKQTMLPPDYVIKTLTIAARKGPPPKKPSGWKYIKCQEKESAADFARRCRSAGL